MRPAGLRGLGLFLLGLVGRRDGAIGGQQDAKRPGDSFPAAGEDLVYLGTVTKHGASLTRIRLRKLSRLTLKFIKQIKRLARGQRVNVDCIQPLAQHIDRLALLLGGGSE